MHTYITKRYMYRTKNEKFPKQNQNQNGTCDISLSLSFLSYSEVTSVEYLGIEMDINGNAKQEYYKGEKKSANVFFLS